MRRISALTSPSVAHVGTSYAPLLRTALPWTTCF